MSEDAQLVEQTLMGDDGAYERLIAKHKWSTVALVVQRIANTLVARDIAQESFVKAYQKLSTLKDRNRFAAWIRSIAVNECRMWLRSKSTKPDAQPLPDNDTLVDANDVPRESLVGVDTAITNLPAGLRAAAVLCLEEELSPSVAAAQLGIKPSTLRKRLHDARKKLQKEIIALAERHLQTHLLPNDFLLKCICECRKRGRFGKEVSAMSGKSQCGCGCTTVGKHQKSVRRKKTKGK